MIRSSEYLAIPPLWCPLETTLHPAAADIESCVQPWMAGFGLDERTLRRAAAATISGWVCRVAPDSNPERLRWFAQWVDWGLTMDDQLIDAGPLRAQPHAYNPLVCRMLNHLLHPETPTDEPFTAALGDLSRRARTIASPALVALWRQTHHAWLLGAACSVSDRAVRRTRTVDDHLIIGVMDRAVSTFTLMIEMVEGTELPAAERAQPAVRAVTAAAQLLVTCYNDIASYSHEVHQDSPESNLVHILATEQHLAPQDAMVAAVAMVDRLMLLFVELREHLETTGSVELRRYLTQLSHMIRGNSDWQRHVPRYTTTLEVDMQALNQLPAIPSRPLYDYASAPSDSRRMPLSASTTWWWSVLN